MRSRHARDIKTEIVVISRRGGSLVDGVRDRIYFYTGPAHFRNVLNRTKHAGMAISQIRIERIYTYCSIDVIEKLLLPILARVLAISGGEHTAVARANCSTSETLMPRRGRRSRPGRAGELCIEGDGERLSAKERERERRCDRERPPPTTTRHAYRTS